MFKRVGGEQIAPELPDVLEEASCDSREKRDYSKPTEMTGAAIASLTVRSSPIKNLSSLSESVQV
ncbi:MAG TPA: hypothetical protein VNE82_17540 [Candidatus Binataceae bacterium]|nr:hypothetical protein [Candidatus Binataceae bacterium]HVB81737.1 hypothetical protein [Candidatus Binataceae bacterium]